MQLHKTNNKTIIVLIIGLYLAQSMFDHVCSIDTLRPGDRLNSTSQLVSANGLFSLGFYTPNGTTDGYLAIWYTNLQYLPIGFGKRLFDDPTTHYQLWIGNRNDPVPHISPKTTLSITTSGKLIIDRGGPEASDLHLIELFCGRGSSRSNDTLVSATLLDSGNFVIKETIRRISGSNGSMSGGKEEEEVNNVLWESFDYPTDTIVPGMKVGVNHKTGRNWTLTSWFGELNPAPGPFTLEWDPTSKRLLFKLRRVLYWTSGKLEEAYEETANVRYKEFENLRGNYLVSPNYTATVDEEYFSYSINRFDGLDKASLWRLDYNGDLIVYSSIIQRVRVASLCNGYERKVTLEDRVLTGCELWEQPKCRSKDQTFVLSSGSVTWLSEGGTETDANSSLSEGDCRENCWNDCECVAFTWGGGFNGGNDFDGRRARIHEGCVYWRGRDFRFEQSVDGSDDRQYVLFTDTSGERRKKVIRITVPVAITTLLLILGSASFILWKFRQRKRKEKELDELMRLEGYTETYELDNGGLPKGQHDLRQFTYAYILEATSNFSSVNKLGEGGFGPVYKGKIPGGHEIAVKVLSRRSGQGLLEFKTELVLISKLQHVNLVKLQGFCIHGSYKLIVYDYMPNKSLDFFLFDPSKQEQLDWKRRFSIIEGVAQGLLYLHKHSRLKIIHRDLKSNNILLDDNMNPKISDFGLAKIFKQDDLEANTLRRAGTYGYMAPEYAMQGIFSIKSDIYSFGVLVLEIVSGRRNNSFHNIEGPLNLVEYAWEVWTKNAAEELMDPVLKDSCQIDQLQRCIHIGLLCVENRAVDRPTIEEVISMLKNEMPSLPVPKNPAFITRNSVVEELGRSSPEKLSCNDLTLSEPGGR